MYSTTENPLLMFLSFRMVHIGAEQTLGMADMRDRLQRIVIQTTHTESLSQRDPAPGPVSTLTGPHQGQSNCCAVLHHHLFHCTLS